MKKNSKKMTRATMAVESASKGKWPWKPVPGKGGRTTNAVMPAKKGGYC